MKNYPLALASLALLMGSVLLTAQQSTEENTHCKISDDKSMSGVVIDSETPTPKGLQTMRGNSGGPGMSVELPASCIVKGAADARTGFGGKPYAIRFELRMPANWNGRFLFQGGGGTDGSVNPALGITNASTVPALAQGYAVVSTDAGHQGMDASFGQDQQARLDYAYRAVDRVAGIAKQLITKFYGKAPDKSYFVGCSNGGRQGMIQAQRFPGNFDGIVAGDPGFRLSYAAVAEAWDTQALMKAAPKDDQNRPILSEALTGDEMTLVGKAILTACDDKDGLKDGLVDNPAACHFDPAILLCKSGQSSFCLVEAKVNALKTVFAGAVNARGERIYSDWPWDPGIASPGWRVWKLGSSKTAVPNAINVSLGFGSLKGYFLTPFDATFDPMKFDFNTDPARVKETAAMNDGVATELNTFSGRGAKLLIYQGMADPVFSANDIIAYYRKLAADNGGMEATRAWSRLFLIPGMCHCGGGPALDQFDPLAAIVDWVEKGKAPESMTAKGASFPGRSRPLCAYPDQAKYLGQGSTEEATNFACR